MPRQFDRDFGLVPNVKAQSRQQFTRRLKTVYRGSIPVEPPIGERKLLMRRLLDDSCDEPLLVGNSQASGKPHRYGMADCFWQRTAALVLRGSRA